MPMEKVNTENRPDRIKAPVLIMSGNDDRLVPPDNSQILKELIPHAELYFYPGCRHCFFIEKSDAFNQNVIIFLKSLKDEGID